MTLVAWHFRMRTIKTIPRVSVMVKFRGLPVVSLVTTVASSLFINNKLPAMNIFMTFVADSWQ
ncbi:MAG: hypothetical protein IPH59_14925 [bacterium]|nr:hypothetical protein [bacterium]